MRFWTVGRQFGSWPETGLSETGRSSLTLALSALLFQRLGPKACRVFFPSGSKNSIDFGRSFMVQLRCKKCLKETEDRLLRTEPDYPDQG